jgi:hypothetical protein
MFRAQLTSQLEDHIHIDSYVNISIDKISTCNIDSYKHFVGVRTRGGPKPTSKYCVSLSWMVMQGEHTGVYPGSGKRRPYVQRGGKFVFPCTEVLV